MARTTILYFFFPEIGGGAPPSTAGYGVGGPTVIDNYPIIGVAGVSTPVLGVVRRTH